MSPQHQSSVQPALDALAILREDALKRIGSAGGNLNGKVRANFTVIETTLLHFLTLESMQSTVNQQTQLVQKVYNDLHKLLAAASTTTNGDDGSSTTKGE